jgi:hypothetical protein
MVVNVAPGHRRECWYKFIYTYVGGLVFLITALDIRHAPAALPPREGVLDPNVQENV